MQDINNEIITNNDFVQLKDDYNSYTINFEYGELIGMLKAKNCSIVKCFSCNLVTHCIHTPSNKLIINKNMIVSIFYLNKRPIKHASILFRYIAAVANAAATLTIHNTQQQQQQQTYISLTSIFRNNISFI